jgi:hypothetical protein
MTSTEPGSTRPGSTTNVAVSSGQGRGTASRPAAGEESTRRFPPAAHYLFALLITLIVTGLAFPVNDPGTKWIVFSVGVLMDVSILIAWARDPSRRREAAAARRR